ncbi:glycosyltransferase family 2 protein [Bacillus shivajii]|uniref:glycosyltransferase family 2 protein n=1 Tax=Bacillus shivajii TaxID=1983719 RepID=UPI001CFB194A|nr:glycosyltransferase family 2 protein [Bacillus shivajii]UCZ54620.1 glycosyltransferase family 2 protein [Bacillus shivajii]
MRADIIIPAYNEGDMIKETLTHLRQCTWINNLIVIDDGSADNTFTEALPLVDKMLHHERNKGKVQAVKTGLPYVEAGIVLLLDADLGLSIIEAEKLLVPLTDSRVDMTIATFPPPVNGGFSLVKRRASHTIYKKTGVHLSSPLSGQRGFKSEWIPHILDMPSVGFGLEMSLNISFLKKGAKLKEVKTNMTHREHGKSMYGFYHRLKQLVEMEKSLWLME